LHSHGSARYVNYTMLLQMSLGIVVAIALLSLRVRECSRVLPDDGVVRLFLAKWGAERRDNDAESVHIGLLLLNLGHASVEPVLAVSDLAQRVSGECQDGKHYVQVRLGIPPNPAAFSSTPLPNA
jgi:hypothetical protein